MDEVRGEEEKEEGRSAKKDRRGKERREKK